MEGLMGILKVLGVVVMMSYTCHMLACGWYYVGGDVKIGDGLEPQRGWIHNQKESVWNATGPIQLLLLMLLAGWHMFMCVS